jgi:Tol biopolymer transport system component
MRMVTATLALPALLLTSTAVPQSAERLFQESPAVWWEEYWSTLAVTPNGREAVYGLPVSGRLRRIDLRSRRDAGPVVAAGVSQVSRAAPMPGGKLALLGTSGGKAGWFETRSGKPVPLPLPADAWQPAWSGDGKQLAYLRQDAADSVFVGPAGRARGHGTGGRATGLAWLPQGTVLLLSMDERGSSTLFELKPASGTMKAVARELDAPPFLAQVAVAPDGRRAYLPLAAAAVPDPEVRQQPLAPRYLGIWEIELATGARHPIVAPTPGIDAFGPTIAGGHLFWIQAATEASVVVLPMTGGAARVVAADGMLPSWRPDGRAIGLVTGNWRMADWALNNDGAAVEVDADARASGPPVQVIVGGHEDFQPVWSPHGRWVAYHSHRPAHVVASPVSPGASDDIWLRRVGAPARDSAEIRLTDFGVEANSPDWSPDGTRLVFTSGDKQNPGSGQQAYIVTIDTAAGRATGHGRVALPPGVNNVAWVAWSPVGDELAIETDEGEGRHALWIVDATGGRGRKVVSFPINTSGGVSWTPDGRKLTYAALTGGRMQLFTVPVSGGKPGQVSHDSANVFTPRVSPDGRLVAATRIHHRKEIWRMPVPR